MAYKALYRKYRPQTFGQVVGQSAIVKTLQNAIISKKTTHAYLFCGPRGTGKTSVARIFAKALNCLNPNQGEPCTECTNCIEISESMSPDVIEIDAASNNGVDEIRDIREKVKFLPSGAKYKIYIIDEVHMLSTGAFNALLKTLEEPPKHVIFILATTEPQKLPSTIISRCQRYDFKPLGTFEISMELKKICDKEDAYITDDAINAISEAAEGGMRDALSILDQVISYGNKDISIEDVNTITGTIGIDKMSTLMGYIESKNVNYALDAVNDFALSGKEVSKIISALLVFCRDVMLYKSIGNKNTNKYIFEKESFQDLAFKLSNAKVMHYIDILCDVQNKIKFSTTPNVYLEIAIIKMCNISDSDLDLIKRLSDVEEKIENGNFTSGDGEGFVDGEKLGLLDTKINQVVTQLNKLELPKLSQRVDDLSQIVANRINQGDSSVDYSAEIEELKLEISQLRNDSLVGNNNEELLMKIEKLEEQLENVPASTTVVDNSKVNKDIEDLTKKVIGIETSVYDLQDNNNVSDLKNEIEVLKEEISNIERPNIDLSSIGQDNEETAKILNELTKVRSDIDELKSSKNNSNEERQSSEIKELKNCISNINDDLHNLKLRPAESSNQDYDMSEIKEKLEMLESRMYKFISSALSSSKSKPKPVKKPNGQIMLFGEEVLGVDYLQKESKIKVDFEDVAKTEEEIQEFDEAEKQKINESVVLEENSYDEDVNTENDQDTYEEVSENESLENEVEIETDDNDLVQEETSEEVTSEKFEIKQEEKVEEETNLFNYEPKVSVEPKVEKPREKDTVISQYFDVETKETFISKKNSSMIVREREEQSQDEIFSSIMKHEGLKREEVKVEQDNHSQSKQAMVDKFASYNVKDIEQILLDSQSQDARNDKARVGEVWRGLSRGISPDMIPVAQLLLEATIVAVGNKELILSYPSVNECNQVMRSKFKKVALKLLYAKLNDTYNYIALPVNVWQEKRLEYVRQYQIGIKRPTLTPLNIKGLNIIDDAEEYVNEEDKIINSTIEFFGGNIVKIEQEN